MRSHISWWNRFYFKHMEAIIQISLNSLFLKFSYDVRNVGFPNSWNTCKYIVLIQIILHDRRHSIGHQHSFHKSQSVVFYNFAIETLRSLVQTCLYLGLCQVFFFFTYFTLFKHSAVINCSNYRRILRSSIFRFDSLLVCRVTQQQKERKLALHSIPGLRLLI